MLHLHFGTGRLGLGLVAPFFGKPGAELHLLNRAQSGSKATGNTRLASARRSELLLQNPEKRYVLQSPGETDEVRETVSYAGFHPYHEDTVQDIAHNILDNSEAQAQGVLVTASILTAENYAKPSSLIVTAY